MPANGLQWRLRRLGLRSSRRNRPPILMGTSVIITATFALTSVQKRVGAHVGGAFAIVDYILVVGFALSKTVLAL